MNTERAMIPKRHHSARFPNPTEVFVGMFIVGRLDLFDYSTSSRVLLGIKSGQEFWSSRGLP
jgi:hypothetical protein